MSAKQTRCRGRCKNEVIGDKFLYTFEMRRGEGVFVRRKGSRKVELVTFARIAEGNFKIKTIEQSDYQFTLDDEGLMIKRTGSKSFKRIPYALLANLGQSQPNLFV